MAEEAALPVAVLQEILAFAHAPALIPTASSAAATAVATARYDFAKRATEPSTAGLLTLARVCKTWRRAVATLLESYEQRVLTLQFTVGNEEAEQAQHEAYLRQHGHLIQDLRIHIVAPKPRLWWEALDSSSSSSSDRYQGTNTDTNGDTEADVNSAGCHSQWIDWEQLFAHCPNVQRLDLSKVPLHHFGIGDILDAGSRRCHRMQALVMPVKERLHTEAVDATIDETFRVLYAALARWCRPSYSSDTDAEADTNGEGGDTNPGRGLVQLTVPSRDAIEAHESTANQFLEAVTAFCPTIEYLDGWKRTYNDLRFVVSEESFCVSLPVWRQLCAKCVRLREFSWVVVPFSDEFFVPFGDYERPQLTHLQLTYNAKAPFRIRRSEYSTDGLCAVVRACPRLQVLDVILHRIQPSHAFVYPHLDEMIDGEVFNDRFVAELASSCPRIESVRIREVMSKGSSQMNSITDSGLRALARLKSLNSVELQGAKCSARGLLILLSGNSTQADQVTARSIKIRELGSQFGEVVTDLLNYLTTKVNETSSSLLPLDCSKPLLLSISSRRGFVFKKSFLENASTAMKERFAHVRFVAVLREKPSSRDKSDGFSRVMTLPSLAARSNHVARIGKLVLYTKRSLLSTAIHERLGQQQAETCIVE
ncbi:hypothetical protein Gpo141_00002532 [Globisporangium polare]